MVWPVARKATRDSPFSKSVLEKAVMETISIASFASFLALSVAGAYWHYRKVCRTGRHYGSLWDYLFADYPGRSGTVGIMLVGSAWLTATSGTADFINPLLVWELVRHGELHVPSIAVAYLAVQSGYAFDSSINKGSIE